MPRIRPGAGVSSAAVDSAVAAAKGLPVGLTGATEATRYVGATASGAPASGTFAIGDFVIDRAGKVWICTAAGTPGTWKSISDDASNSASYAPLGVGQSRVAISMASATSAESAAAAFSGSSSQAGGGWRYHGAQATDYIEFATSLRAGTYTLSHLGPTNTSYGIVEVRLDGVALATTFDTYSASAGYNVLTRITGISVATSGSHTWKFWCPTKNASSSAYRHAWTQIEIARTGD